MEFSLQSSVSSAKLNIFRFQSYRTAISEMNCLHMPQQSQGESLYFVETMPRCVISFSPSISEEIIVVISEWNPNL